MNPTNEQELDPIINIMDMWDFAPLQDEDIRRERVYKEIQAHTNAEITKVLDRLQHELDGGRTYTSVSLIEDAVQAERAKLKEVK